MASPFKIFLKFSVGTWINAAVSLVSIPIITWFIAPAELGKAALFTITYNLLVSVFLLGVDQSFVRFFNEPGSNDKSKLLANSLAPTILIIIVGVLSIWAFRTEASMLLFSSQKYAFAVDILLVAIFAGCINRYALLVLRMQNKAISYSAVQVLLTVSNLTLTILLIQFSSKTFVSVVLGFTTSQVLALLLAVGLEWSLWKKVVVSIRKIDTNYIKELLIYGIPFIPTLAFDWIFQSSDRTFLRIYSNFSEIGIYSTATRIAAALNIIQTSFSTFWIPFVFERFSKNEQDKSFYPEIFNTIAFVFLLAIQTAIAFKGIIHFLLPTTYHQSINIFALLLFVPMFYSLSDITSVGINLRKRTIHHLYVLIACSAVSIGAGLLLIPPLGAKGAVISSFLSYVTFFVFRTHFGLSSYSLPINWANFLVVLIPTAITAFIAFFFPGFSVFWLCAGCIALTIFIYKETTINVFLRFKSLKK